MRASLDNEHVVYQKECQWRRNHLLLNKILRGISKRFQILYTLHTIILLTSNHVLPHCGRSPPRF